MRSLLYFAAFHILFGICGAANFILLFGPFLYPREIGLFLSLPYFSWVFLSRPELNKGLPWPWFSKKFAVFQFLRNVLRLQFEGLPHDASVKQYIFACHPHGVWSDFRMLIDGMFREKGVAPYTLAASVLFRLPVVREIALWTGCVDARRSVATNIIKRGDSMFVLPGGEAEQIRTKFGHEIVYIRNRKGFVKLALRHGVEIVPAYAFGVSDYYYTSTFLYGPRLWLTKILQVCIPLASGVLGSPLCPRPVKTTVVFGKPLKFEQIDEPTTGQLDKAHGAYIAALTKLFDSNKERLGYGDRQLEIV